MKSIRGAHIVVVAASKHGPVLTARLCRMDVALVTPVADLEEARRLCRAGGVDACIVMFDDCIADAEPLAESDAPGRHCGVPSLMFVPQVTPHLRAVARRCGYLAAVPAAIPPRLLYRRIGGALQQRRAARRSPPRRPAGIVPLLELPRTARFSRPTIH